MFLVLFSALCSLGSDSSLEALRGTASRCASGYTGDFCTLCSAGYYQAAAQRCYFCGLTSKDRRNIAFLFVAAAAYFSVVIADSMLVA
jgi:hypothetical protein